ncbi:MAG: flagellar biosynthetic protein FliO [Desulfurispora sp.]|uniref:flagellar biosynthetic protein FliO n=1 Tax=Desulfurispora sp. TaxID=3014275 RepID=UPI004049A688
MDKEMWLYTLRLALFLPLVLLMAYFLIKYILSGRLLPAGVVNRRCLRFVEQLPLGTRSALVLVQVGGEYLLLAREENRLHLLKHYPGLPVLPEDRSPGGC